jgi:BirA family transcriptional regulator, biotin operon repressor / biotin---[acetyl-CoA-carboxylase] ligase
LPVFSDVRRFGEIDSTNTWLLAEARAGAPEGLVAVADHQSAGRGRLDRRWEAPPGAALLVSVLLRPVLEPGALHLATALVALSALDACRQTAGVDAGIKWPNDLVVADAKLAGVLAEADPSAGGGTAGSVAVVVGIGLNIEPPGRGASSNATSLAELVAAGRGSAVPSRDALLSALLYELERRRPELDDAEGRRALGSDLRSRCVTLGRAVRVELGTTELIGTATGLTDEGALVVETDAGRRVVTAGDVVHLRGAAPPT